MKTTKALRLYLLACLSIAFATSCNKDETPSYDIPSTYNFQNASYNGQTQRLAMLGELQGAMEAALSGNVVDANNLKAMYANDGATWNGTYEASKQLKSKTFEQQQAYIEAILDAHALASQSTEPASNGQAGLATNNSNRTYLLGPGGQDYIQLLQKGLMGSCFYYQATAVYFGTGKMDVDNETITEGEGTEMEHHWDEAFGYLGVPIDFPTNIDGLFYWGSYSNQRNEVLNCNGKLMSDFLKGRAAISNKDLATRDEMITSIRGEWERVAVGSAIHYINSAVTDFDDTAARCHLLSEGIAFAQALAFNPDKKITNAEIDEIVTAMAGSTDLAQMNLYNVTVENLQVAKNKLSQIYNLEGVKDQL